MKCFLWLQKVSECSLKKMSGHGSFRWQTPGIPTLGGRQFWSDILISAGSRVQRNFWTGHHRTLDAANRRHGFGSRETCLEAIGRASSPGAALDDGVVDRLAGRRETLIVFLHGLFRSRASLGLLERRLALQGWSTLAIEYPSAVGSIFDHARQVNDVLNQTRGYSRVIFVGHSLGGLVARAALVDPVDWRSRMTVVGLIQLGTPNRGAQLARWLCRSAVLRKLLTAPVRELTAKIDVPEPALEVPVTVIAGGRSGGGYNPWLDGNNDGVVRVEETVMARAHSHHVVPAIHTLLMNHPRTTGLVARTVRAWSSAPCPRTTSR